MKGDFSFMINSSDDTTSFYGKCLEDIWNTIHGNERYIKYIMTRTHSAPFSMENNPVFYEITRALKYHDQHSGCSIAIMFRNVQNIMINKISWEKFCEDNSQSI